MAAAAAAALQQEMRQHLENLRSALRDRNIIQLAEDFTSEKMAAQRDTAKESVMGYLFLGLGLFFGGLLLYHWWEDRGWETKNNTKM